MSHQCHTKIKGLEVLKYVALTILREKAGCSAVGSALRSGRRGRAFESPHPDRSLTGHPVKLFCFQAVSTA